MEVKKSLFLIIALTLTACVDNYTLMTSAEEMWSNGGTTLTVLLVIVLWATTTRSYCSRRRQQAIRQS